MIRKKIFRKSLIMVLLITSIPIALVGTATHYFGRQQIEKEVTRSHNLMLERAASRIEEQLEQIELTTTQWTMDPIFDPSKMLSLNLNTDYHEIHNLYQSLMVMRNTNPLIDKIDVYLAGSAVTINDTDGIVYLKRKSIPEADYLPLVSLNGYTPGRWDPLVCT